LPLLIACRTDHGGEGAAGDPNLGKA
jgi:hypothetical protein